MCQVKTPFAGLFTTGILEKASHTETAGQRAEECSAARDHRAPRQRNGVTDITVPVWEWLYGLQQKCCITPLSLWHIGITLILIMVFALHCIATIESRFECIELKKKKKNSESFYLVQGRAVRLSFTGEMRLCNLCKTHGLNTDNTPFCTPTWTPMLRLSLAPKAQRKNFNWTGSMPGLSETLQAASWA